MNIYTNIPYVYRICWSETGMNYVGVRYAQDCHPSDLFVTYFTSSTYVADYIKEHGLPDIIEIRKTFTSPSRVNESREWESRVLSKLKVTKNKNYLNMSTGKGIPPMYGDDNPMSDPVAKANHKSAINDEEHRKNKSIKSKSAWENPDYRKLQHDSRTQSWDNDIERKESVSKHFSSLWEDPNYREVHSAKRKKLWEDPEHYAKMLVTRQGKRNGRFDSKVYIFKHVSGAVETTTRYDLILKYKLNKGSMCSVVKTFGVVHKGWVCVGISDVHGS